MFHHPRMLTYSYLEAYHRVSTHLSKTPTVLWAYFSKSLKKSVWSKFQNLGHELEKED